MNVGWLPALGSPNKYAMPLHGSLRITGDPNIEPQIVGFRCKKDPNKVPPNLGNPPHCTESSYMKAPKRDASEMSDVRDSFQAPCGQGDGTSPSCRMLSMLGPILSRHFQGLRALVSFLRWVQRACFRRTRSQPGCCLVRMHDLYIPPNKKARYSGSRDSKQECFRSTKFEP